MAATLWPNRLGVISHDSALDLWDLCDVNPAKIHVTVPKAPRVRRQVPSAYAVHVRSLDEGDVTNVDGIPVVTPLRAILDGIERHLDDRLIRQAIDGAQRRGLLVDNELSRIAEVRA
jgi:predicted transcriptional regulator of viral defense system